MEQKARFGDLFWTLRGEYFQIMHNSSQTFNKFIKTLSTASLGFTINLINSKSSSGETFMNTV